MRRLIYPPDWKCLPGPGGYLSALIRGTRAIPPFKTIGTGLLLLFLLFLPVTAKADSGTKRVLVVTSYDLNRPAVALFVQNLRSTIGAGTKERVEFFYEFQETTRISSAKYGDAMVAYMKRKYEGEKFDLIVALGEASLKLLLDHESEVFTAVPKIFYFHDEREENVQALWPHSTGVWAKLDIADTLGLALQLKPDTKQVVVVTGSSEEDKFLKDKAQHDLQKYEGKVAFTYLNDLSMDELKAKTAALPPKTVVLYLAFFLDKQGNSYSGPEALSLFAPTSTAPIFGISETYVGVGIVGGSVIDFAGLGKRTGELGLQMLAGARSQDIRPQTVPNVTTFDWRQLHRWGIAENKLPAASVVQFRTPGFWQLYKWYVLGIVVLLLVETLLIARLLLTQSRRREAEREQQRLSVVAETEHKRLGEIVDNVPGIVWETVIDPATKERKTTFISDYLRRMLGYTPQEWTAAAPGFGFKIMAEEDRAKAMRESEAVIQSGKEGVSQFRWHGKDGQTVWAESHLSPISDGNRKIIGLRGVTLDITQRKLAEGALRQAEEKARAILSAIPDLMFLQTRDGVYLDYHAKDPKDLLVPPSTFMGKNMRDVLPPDLANQFAVCFERAVDSGEPQIVEYQVPINEIDRSYEARIVRSGENVLTVVREITERKRVIDELRQSEERFSKAFRANPQPMSLTTVAEGRYVDVNESFLSMSGYAREDVIGHTSLELEIWETPDHRAEFISQLREKGALRNIEAKFRIKDGSLRLLLSSAERLELGGEECLLVASSDITERMAAQEALAESEARFRNMADTAPVMIWVSGTDRLSSYFNQQWLDFTGRTMEQEMGNGWLDGIHPDDYGQCLQAHFEAFDRRVPFRMEYRLRAADGSFRWVIDSGMPRFSATGEFLGFIGSCVDISDRKLSEEALVTAHKELVVAHEEVNRLKNKLEAENIYLQQELQLDQTFGEMVGQSDALKYVQFKVSQVALTDSTVLITGETGTGKELVARAIHGASLRKDRPLIKVNCAALPATLIESELFGYERGAFTGAASRKLGRFELANGGTIFLDEIGDLPLESQVKLLRTIQEGEIERLGGTKTVKINVRIIAATNRNLKQETEKGRFREDLWYRLNVFPITVPPLRQRKEDIGPLTDYFASKLARKFGKKIDSVSASAMRTLKEHSWPGNIRELENVIERAVIHCQGSVLHLSERFDTPSETVESTTKSLEEIERDYIVRILKMTSGRIEGPNGAARILGLNPSTLRTRIVKLGIQKQSLSAGR